MDPEWACAHFEVISQSLILNDNYQFPKRGLINAILQPVKGRRWCGERTKNAAASEPSAAVMLGSCQFQTNTQQNKTIKPGSADSVHAVHGAADLRLVNFWPGSSEPRSFCRASGQLLFQPQQPSRVSSHTSKKKKKKVFTGLFFLLALARVE